MLILQIPFQAGPLTAEAAAARSRVATQQALYELGELCSAARKQRRRKAQIQMLLSGLAVLSVALLTGLLSAPLLLPSRPSTALVLTKTSDWTVSTHTVAASAS